MNHDIVFISYDEENAEENWKKLLTKYPQSKRVHGVKGIREAHHEASLLAETNFFYTLDGDNQLLDSFSFNSPENLETDSIYVWRCLNPINGLVYGFGGLKLWSKKTFSNSLKKFQDHATNATKKYIVINELGSKTLYATSPYPAWRSGFREATKLFNNIKKQKDNVSLGRLNSWINVGTHTDLGQYVIKGARQGLLFALENNEDVISTKINDFNILKDLFDQNINDDDVEIFQRLLDNKISVKNLTPEESYEEYSENISKWKDKI